MSSLQPLASPNESVLVVLSSLLLLLFGMFRGYAESKIKENVTAEIMQVIHDEAFDSYDDSVCQYHIS